MMPTVVSGRWKVSASAAGTENLANTLEGTSPPVEVLVFSGKVAVYVLVSRAIGRTLLSLCPPVNGGGKRGRETFRSISASDREKIVQQGGSNVLHVKPAPFAARIADLRREDRTGEFSLELKASDTGGGWQLLLNGEPVELEEMPTPPGTPAAEAPPAR